MTVAPASDSGVEGRTVAVLGLGEAGSEIASDLVRLGARVVGFDPADVGTPDAVRRADEPGLAVRGADLVLALTAASDASTALEQVVDAVPPAILYADLSSASPELKRRLASTAAEARLDFVDVALMSTVPGTGLFTPQLASGAGAERYCRWLGAAGVPVEDVGIDPGVAATRKLLRSVAIKGVGTAVIEAMRAAEAAGLATETWRNLAAQFDAMDEDFLRRTVSGTGTHAVRRTHEMEAAVELLEQLGVEPVVTRATVEGLRQASVDGVPRPPE